MKALGLALALLGAATLTGCQTVTKLWEERAQIETAIAAHAEGEYELVLYKDGNPLVSERWECTRGEDGKLSGCHKR